MRIGCVVFGIVATLLASCGPQAGDSCTSSAQCGSQLACYACNVPDGAMAVCSRPCTTNTDCNGTSDSIGPTPVCSMDVCGNHFCGHQI